ncbi:MAG TPA: diguanylate cyclase [Burkholderiaceae bacterium]|nr:diguanylate cyclase [Burkholderiaceae bacterium]
MPTPSSMPAVYADLLALLRRQLPFALWMVTRIDGDDWIVLQVDDRHYGVSAGQRFVWSDSVCSRMVRGLGPTYSPDIRLEPGYRDAPIAARLEIGAYLGVPILRPDGSALGTLCAIDPKPFEPPELADGQRALVETVARTLGALMELQLRHDALVRRSRRGVAPEIADPVTGLAERAAFEAALRDEQLHFDALGGDAGVLAVGVDHLETVRSLEGPAMAARLLQAVSGSLQASAREHDLVARVGDATFGLLMPGCRSAEIDLTVERLRRRLEREGLRVSIGGCGLVQATSSARAWRVACGLLEADRTGRR